MGPTPKVFPLEIVAKLLWQGLNKVYQLCVDFISNLNLVKGKAHIVSWPCNRQQFFLDDIYIRSGSYTDKLLEF